MKKLSYAYLMLATFLSAGLQATPPASVDSTTINVKTGFGLNNCWGANANCPVSITIGGGEQDFNFDTTKAKMVSPETNGRIEEEDQLVQFEVPKDENSELFYSYIPTAGTYAGKKIYLAFANLPATGRLAGQTDVRIYRLIEGQKQSEKVKLATLDAREVHSNIVAFDFEPNGDFRGFDPKRKTTVSFPAGQVLIPGQKA